MYTKYQKISMIILIIIATLDAAPGSMVNWMEALPLGNGRFAATFAVTNFLANPVRQQAYCPVGDLKVVFPGHNGATNYYRDIELGALAHVRYTVGNVSFTRVMFISAPDQVLVAHYNADKPQCSIPGITAFL